MEGWMEDGQTLLYGTLPAKIRGPINGLKAVIHRVHKENASILKLKLLLLVSLCPTTTLE